MVKARGDRQTLGLLEWEPPTVEVKFDDEAKVRAATISHRISRSVSTILTESGLPREAVAEAMSEFLGARLTATVLNGYASEGREANKISLERAEALLHATGDPRIFGDILSRHGYAVIPKRYLGAIEEAMCDEIMERTMKRKKIARRTWSGGQS